jgi:hypothetical protein
VWINASSGSICHTFVDPEQYPVDQDVWWIVVSPHPRAAIRLAFSDSSFAKWTFGTEVLY